MASKKRFVLEATWGGYHAGQSHVVHREVLTRMRDAFEKIKSLRFGDGTLLFVTIRDAAPRERVQEKLGYKSVLHGAAYRKLEGFGIPVESTC